MTNPMKCIIWFIENFHKIRGLISIFTHYMAAISESIQSQLWSHSLSHPHTSSTAFASHHRFQLIVALTSPSPPTFLRLCLIFTTFESAFSPHGNTLCSIGTGSLNHYNRGILACLIESSIGQDPKDFAWDLCSLDARMRCKTLRPHK